MKKIRFDSLYTVGFARDLLLLVFLLSMFFCFSATASEQTIKSLTDPIVVTSTTPNETCLSCHGVDGFSVPTDKHSVRSMRKLSFNVDEFSKSVHGKELCVSCHADIHQIPHKKGVKRTVHCTQCHQQQIEKSNHAGFAKNMSKSTIGLVEHETNDYLGSIHAKPSKIDPSRPNASCIDCHTPAHFIYPMKSKRGLEFRDSIPSICGRCHEKTFEKYQQSVHSASSMRLGHDKAAVCSDCHTAHKVSSPAASQAKLVITKNCGNCHQEEYMSYRHTYHGQVASLGYAYTAKCFDCHGSHSITDVNDPLSKVYKNNRINTCKQCHKEASKGFLSFDPHGNTHDFERYPLMWLASKGMILLLAGVFTFFWTHSILWFWRERKDRMQHPVQKNNNKKELYVRRFSWQWRLAHLILALVVMVLALTGTSVLYADSFWAPFVMKMIGGPKVAAILHRIAAVMFAILFFGHIIVVAYKDLFKKKGKKRFEWFGPDSLLPRWQDFRDLKSMVLWFIGKGPRPVFDHWTYWEKFDYWAPFWGMFIIGVSGALMWNPELTASLLPGWVFNIAIIVHGEEAFLAVVFLFTVHFFNCHFRPDKLPQDISIFTGVIPLEEFKHERAVEYKRVVKENQLDDLIVKAPSSAMVTGSKILGATLIVVGLALLTLVLLGFWQGVLFGW